MTDAAQTSRPWLASYPPGVPATIDADAHRSLQQVLERSMARNAARPAYVSLGRTLSYADLERLSADLAAWLQQVAGLAKGDQRGGHQRAEENHQGFDEELHGRRQEMRAGTARPAAAAEIERSVSNRGAHPGQLPA